jgi:hypothetical protein
VVKDHAWQLGGHILSLVEPCAEDQDHKALNETVLQTTEHFTRLLKGDCHLIDCYYGETASLSFHQATSPETDREYHMQQMSLCSSRYHLLPETITATNEHFTLLKHCPKMR